VVDPVAQPVVHLDEQVAAQQLAPSSPSYTTSVSWAKSRWQIRSNKVAHSQSSR
jgi:hypothetical protein